VKPANRPSHITKGDIFDDLGLSRSEASALKIKATLLDAILNEIEKRGYTQSELVEILDEYQPSISNLTRGKIAKVSVEKLLTYSDRLNMKATLTVRGSSEGHRNNHTLTLSRFSARSTPRYSRSRGQASVVAS
jgi:predicted XRE-type DNA-binding protein